MSDDYPRICALPECLHADAFAEEARWQRVGSAPENPLLWTILASLPGVSDDEFKQTIAEVWAEIGKACNFHARYTDTARAAHMRIGTGRIDGRGGTLAWSELANGADTPLRQMYDDGEGWGLFDGQAAGRTDLYRVILHETLHLVGFPHRPTNGPDSILKPFYSPTVRHLTTADIAMLRGVYGPPKDIPQPPPPPPTDTRTAELERAIGEIAAIAARVVRR